MMDNTRKRKIVRNFVIGYLLLQVLVIVLYLGFWALLRNMAYYNNSFYFYIQ